MDLRNAVITEVLDTYSLYSLKGRFERMQNRKCFGLSLCSDGQITYIQDGKEYISNKDTAVILPKGGNYYIRGDKTGFFAVIDFDCVDVLCDTVTVIQAKNTEELFADYENIKKLLCFEGNKARIFSIFYDMLHKLSRNSTPPLLSPAIKMIRSDYNNTNLTNEVLAKACNLSEVYFRKLFVMNYKSSPHQYIIEIRLQKAKQLLSEGALSVTQIAEVCGFSNPYHFCRLFKKHTGSSPSEYKRNNLILKI